MKLTPPGRFLLTGLEGKRYRDYKDAAGNDTVGIGHLIRKHERNHLMGRDLSHGEIETLLSEDLHTFETGVLDACVEGGLMPSQSQFDAFVLLAFNIGMKHFMTSSVLRRFLNHDAAGAAAAFLMWNKITITDRKTGRKKLVASRALEARRIAESRVFLHGYYDETPYQPLDDDERIKGMNIPGNTPENPNNVMSSGSEARPDLKTSRTLKATTAGQAGTGVVGAAAGVGVIKSVADQAKSAADSAGAAMQSVTDAAEVTVETANIFSNLSMWIYISIGAGALVILMSFIFVRRVRRDDWRRGLR